MSPGRSRARGPLTAAESPARAPGLQPYGPGAAKGFGRVVGSCPQAPVPLFITIIIVVIFIF